MKFLYEINPYGVLRNIKSKKYMTLSTDKDGYKVWYANNQLLDKRVYRIHRLVAEVFILNPNNYPVINHIDENKINNYYKNLEWCTVQYNNIYGSRLQNVSESVRKYHNVGKILMVEENKLFDTLREAAEYVCKKLGKTNLRTVESQIKK